MLKEFCLGDSISHSKVSHSPKHRGTQNPWAVRSGNQASATQGDAISLIGVNVRGKMVYSCPAEPNERRGILRPILLVINRRKQGW